MTARIILVDDHPVLRDGMRMLLAADPGIEVIGQAGSGEEALTLVQALERRGDAPDLVLMDLQLGAGISGIEATRALRAAHPDVRVLILTTFDADTDIFGALDAGAVGYLLKDTPTDALVRSVLDAASGRPTLSPEVAMRVMGRAAHPDTGLSTRETEILGLLATGAGNRDIARRLFISESTVKGHLVNLYAKLGVDNRTSAAKVARERRLIR
ncbi:LuxR family two component transcriptional regulator [Luteococcus japonicus]|uniref:LuxR family two component transcriptional regulator n=2 Tax=Luteococcus japonicus TaxID=33984 RepID=A0A3N1ZPV5_9ACTN|nr:response regulator transcription factor [Luteococcus japonicus]ROR52939.1 LuxR family two component transcriptional regulator [Luteococcus japonicus]SJN36292.1 putative two-component system response regulator [Luteococcus japonicus LSP_Lj1]